MISLSVRDEQELMGVARALLAELEKTQGHILGLSGDLGVGKTALSKAIARTLSIQEDITSPTFVIMKSYPIPNHSHFKTLIHMDAYRIENDDELRVLGFEELKNDPQNLILIEWPERVKNVVGKGVLQVTMDITEETTRHITYGS